MGRRSKIKRRIKKVESRKRGTREAGARKIENRS
jgi:hypothetical protein